MRKLVAALCLAAAALAPAAPAAASDPSPIVELRDCPDGYVGYAIHVYDRGLWWGCYRLP